jgi:TPR repeat protein
VPVGTVRAVPEDVVLADLTKLRVLAAQGDADAEYVLGERYATGNGLPQDDKAAAEWWLKAARQGHAHAQHNIGCFYREGRGVAQDHKAAFEWTLKAARQGHAVAQTNTGVSYGQGKDVEQDYDQAMAWFLKAAQQGQAHAQFNAATYFEQGLGGVAVDHKAALDLYLKHSTASRPCLRRPSSVSASASSAAGARPST